jgi:large subunit ribosomal protein L4
MYYMLPWHMRVYGLTHTLSVKMVQDDVHVVDSLELPTDDPAYLLELVRARGWAPSVLMVDTEDHFPSAVTSATEEIPHINLMPVYGLNVHSMVKHETLVITQRAVEDLTAK